MKTADKQYVLQLRNSFSYIMPQDFFISWDALFYETKKDPEAYHITKGSSSTINFPDYLIGISPTIILDAESSRSILKSFPCVFPI